MSDFLESCLEKASGIDDSILMGELNANLFERNAHTKLLDQIDQTINLDQIIDHPTRVTETASTLIDHIYVSNSSLISDSDVIHFGISDHSAIYACRCVCSRGHKEVHLHIEYRDFRAFNESKFIDDVNSAPWPFN